MAIIVSLPPENGALILRFTDMPTEVLLAKIADGACLPDLTGSSQLIEEVNARG